MEVIICRDVNQRTNDPDDSIYPETGHSSFNHDQQNASLTKPKENNSSIGGNFDEIPSEDLNIQIFQLVRSILPRISLLISDQSAPTGPANRRSDPRDRVPAAESQSQGTSFSRKDRFTSHQNILGEFPQKIIKRSKNLTQMYPSSQVSEKYTGYVRSKTATIDRDCELKEEQMAKYQISTALHSKDEKTLPFPKKKWVFCRICRIGSQEILTPEINFKLIGFSENTIMKAFKYLDTLDLNAPKEILLQKVLEYLESEFTATERTIAIKAIKTKPSIDIQSFKKEHSMETNVIFEMDSENHEDNTSQPRGGPICKICFHKVKSSQMCTFLSCQHEYCLACTREYLEDRILSFKVLNMKCPHEGCDYMFEDEHLKSIMDSSLFNKYLRFKNSARLNQNPHLRWCIRAGCEKYMIGEPDSSFLKCECGQEICFDCCNEYHPEKTCEEMIDLIYKEYAKQVDIQLCRSCKSRVEKDDGCNHIRCSVCGNEWCWLCGAKYTKHHYSFLNPFGCSGLQAGTHTKTRWPLWKRMTWKSFQIFTILLLILLLPLIGAGALVLAPWMLYRQRELRKKKGKIPKCKSFLFIVFGVLGLPLTIIFCIVYLLFILIRFRSNGSLVSERSFSERNLTNGHLVSKLTDRASHRKAITNATTRDPRQYDDERSDESIPSENRFQVVNID